MGSMGDWLALWPGVLGEVIGSICVWLTLLLGLLGEIIGEASSSFESKSIERRAAFLADSRCWSMNSFLDSLGDMVLGEMCVSGPACFSSGLDCCRCKLGGDFTIADVTILLFLKGLVMDVGTTEGLLAAGGSSSPSGFQKSVARRKKSFL